MRLLNTRTERGKTEGGYKRENICFISIQVFGTDGPVLSIGSGVSNTEKCCSQTKHRRSEN